MNTFLGKSKYSTAILYQRIIAGIWLIISLKSWLLRFYNYVLLVSILLFLSWVIKTHFLKRCLDCWFPLPGKPIVQVVKVVPHLSVSYTRKCPNYYIFFNYFFYILLHPHYQQLKISNDLERIFNTRLIFPAVIILSITFLVINFDETPARSVNPYDIDAIQEMSGNPLASVVRNCKTGLIIKCASSLQADKIN